MEYEFFASCLQGTEKLVADELRSLGVVRVRPLGGGVAFFGTAEDAMRACLWLRTASRVLMVLGRTDAADADELYAGARAIDWARVLAPSATFSVRAHGANDKLRNTRFTALKVKDAIADVLRGHRAEPAASGRIAPRASIEVRLRGTRATISLDFSGEALSHRMYFTADDGEDAALVCSVAAALLARAGWFEAAGGAHTVAFVDPACSSGILLVEAAMAACDRAPGFGRSSWGFEAWAEYDADAFARLTDQAAERFDAGLARIAGKRALDAPSDERPDLERIRFTGASSSSPAIKRARDHVRRAGLRQVASVDWADAESAPALTERTVRAARGERPCVLVASDIDADSRATAPAQVHADEDALIAACMAAAKAAKAKNADTVFAAAGAVDIAARFAKAPSARMEVGSGRIQTRIEVFDEPPADPIVVEIPSLTGDTPRFAAVSEAGSSQFAARLRKMFKERRKWAANAGVSCYRIYDADLRDYAVAIDVYTGAGDARGNTYLHISEYAPPASVDADRARRRFLDVLAIAPVVCSVRPDHVFTKTRVKEKGGGQYRTARQRSYATTVEEAGHLFEVDLAGRLDTGLFLDHRLTRQLIADKAQDARFCNLFAYTGTATVYAAAGGARETVTVDMSSTYLDWARRNMAANGFAGDEHRFEKADALRWITEARRSGRRFDLVFVDPPTFSNSKAMGKRTWDVQRDHVEMLIGVSRLLFEDGIAVFSCNLRSFKPDVEQLAKYGVSIEDISMDTIPEDFVRTPKIHKCYIVKHI